VPILTPRIDTGTCLVRFSTKIEAVLWVLRSVVDPKLFFSDADPTFQEISDPDPISDPTSFISKEAIFFMLMHFGSTRPYF